MKVVVVESPAKAKTINKYLGSDFTVLASYGHIRDLPAKDGSVDPENGFAMQWETDPKSLKHVKEIRQALKGATDLYLATDPDREGEAISWHVQNVLSEGKGLVGKSVKRIVFNEITKTAVQEALRNPRDVNQELVDAYLARRALDYLVGFTLSPVLWRKLPGSRSAGRVQSVALRLVCERESEIERFITQEYWTVAADFKTPRNEQVSAQLTHLDGKKLDKFDLPNEAAAKAAEQAIEGTDFHVKSVERKTTKRNPYPPFTTSTLQQEASRKLHFSARQTMQLAQRLYEGVDIGGETVGLITYMRTDSVHMAGEAIAACRELIAKDYGDAYLPKSPRQFKTKSKNAQEAHEAIRPTQLSRRPAQVAKYLDRDQLRLYELIWKRAVACQMESAVLDQVAVDIASPDEKLILRANGSVIKFDGFLTLYREDRDDADDADEADRLLPGMTENEAMDHQKTRPEQHFTQPPPRFSEASLVKRMEELGIGRPSTYASILSVLQDRDYVRLENRRFIPEDRGRLVTAFLENFFSRYVQYTFTADLEDQLDEIADGAIAWKSVLDEFWKPFHQSVDDTKELRITEVLNALDEALGPHFFPVREDGHDPRQCPSCADGRLSLKLGKFGAFIGCSNYPECRHTRPLVVSGENGGDAAELAEGPKELGADPASGKMVTLRKGPYGHYVQLGEAEGKDKPKRVSLPKGLAPPSVELPTALALLDLPRPIGAHPESGKPITAGIGRFGPYIKHESTYKSLAADDDVLTIGLNRAVDLLASTSIRTKAPAGTVVGAHPDDGASVTFNKGRFGPYVSHNGVHATLPRDHQNPEGITLEEAVELIRAKVAKGGTAKKKAPVKKAAAKTTTAKAKTTATKTTATKAKTAKTAAKAEGEDAPVKKAPAKKAAAKTTAKKAAPKAAS